MPPLKPSPAAVKSEHRYETYRDRGIAFASWPEDCRLPVKGSAVAVFDRDLKATHHFVTALPGGRAVTVGPAQPWPEG